MPNECYHRAPAALATAALLLPWSGVAVAAAPLVEQWVDVTDRPAPSDRCLATHERRTDDLGRIWQRVLVEDPGALTALGFSAGPATPPPPLPTGYRDPTIGAEVLAAAVARSPRAGTTRLGWSVQERPIDAAWFGQPPSAGAPTVRVLADHHGDEGPAWELALDLATRLADGDGVDPAVTSLLDARTVWVVPYVNPDGTAAGTRTNAAGVDLNRNYDFAWSATEFRAGDRPFSEPETRAVRQFGDVVRPTLGLSLHAGAANLGWPWNFTEDDPPDAAEFERLAEGYAERCTTPGFWITQGADWYVTRGDTNDWAYGRWGTLDLTLELSTDKLPPASALPGLTGQHLDAVLATLATPFDVVGTVVDADTGRPLEARVSMDGGAPVWTDRSTGRFARWAPDGGDRLWIDAPGYASVEVPVDAGTVALKRTAEDGTASPFVVFLSGTVRLPLPIDGPVFWTRPGADDVPGLAHDGEVWVDPEAMGAGLWSLRTADGRVFRAALLVADGLAPLGEPYHDTVAWWSDPGPGARAFLIEGAERTLREVPLVEANGLWSVQFDDPASDRFDLLVVASGAVFGFEDLGQDSLPRDTGTPPDVVGGGGCGTIPGHQGTARVSVGLLGVALAARRRRRG